MIVQQTFLHAAFRVNFERGRRTPTRASRDATIPT